MSSKLKPCPYCGKEAILISHISRGGLFEREICCVDRYGLPEEIKGKRCLAIPSITRYEETEEEAEKAVIEAWNTRAKADKERE